MQHRLEVYTSITSTPFCTAPSVACVEVSEDDLLVWKKLSTLVIAEGVESINLPDGRCVFYSTPGDEEPDLNDPNTHLEVNAFEQETPKLSICGDGVYWHGFESDGSLDTYWKTTKIRFFELE